MNLFFIQLIYPDMPGFDDTKFGRKGKKVNVTNRNEHVIDETLDSLPYRNNTSLVMS